MMKRILLGLGIVALIAIAYLAFWPVPINPVAWDAPESQGYTGDFAPNTDLANLERLSIGDTYGPEDVAAWPPHIKSNQALPTQPPLRIYTSGHEGDIIEIDPVAKTQRSIVNTGGVPLGIEFGPDGILYVADAHKGLLSVTRDGVMTVLTDTVDGTPILFADDLDIGPDGVIYFSDASTRFGAEAVGSTLGASLLEVIEHGRTGRVLAYDPVTQKTRIIKDGLSFSNGVAMGPDGMSILVIETGEYRVYRIWVSGPRKGESTVIIDNLPGFPDNINPGPDGTYLVGLVSKRIPFLDQNDENLSLRKLGLRLPAFLRPKPISYGLIVQIDAGGTVLRTWQDPSAGYPQTTGAIIASDGYMYVSSLAAKTLARKKITP